MKLPKLGFGCYRIDHRVQEHYQALRKAVLSGVTLIDTSTNYADGSSEILVGNLLTDLLEEDAVKREDITLVTKVGYIQGQNLKNAVKRKEKGKPFTEVVEYGEGLWHCISPDFIEDQLNHQLTRLNQDYIDIYLLHNPEYYLGWAEKKGMDLSEAQQEYYMRIKKAFQFLEKKVEEGKIKSYGISSNTFVSPADKYDFTSLEDILELADSVEGENSFTTIQFPFNLVEIGAISEKNQEGGTKTVLQLAGEKDLNVLINRPLNAITSKGLVRLADFDYKDHDAQDFMKQVQRVKLMEDDMIQEKLVNYQLSENDDKILKGLFKFGKKIEENWSDFGSIEHLNDSIEHYFGPRINYLMDYFEANFSEEDMQNYFGKYLKELYRLLNLTTNYYKISAMRRNSFIHSVIDTLADPKYYHLTLSQKAILILLSVKGVSTVLVGARREQYVEDIIKVIDLPAIDNAKDILYKLQEELLKDDYSTPDL